MKATYLHYDNGKDYDVIDIIKDYQLNFNKGNIIKYICRAGKKDNELKDLEKAADYLKREIEYLRNEQKKWIEENK
jgi:FtsZ-binding cell division protein ZapB